MDGRIFNIAEATMYLSRLIGRVERGDEITIERNNHPVAMLAPARPSAPGVLARIDDVRGRIGTSNNGSPIRRPGESWYDFIQAGRRT